MEAVKYAVRLDNGLGTARTSSLWDAIDLAQVYVQMSQDDTSDPHGFNVTVMDERGETLFHFCHSTQDIRLVVDPRLRVSVT